MERFECRGTRVLLQITFEKYVCACYEYNIWSAVKRNECVTILFQYTYCLSSSSTSEVLVWDIFQTVVSHLVCGGNAWTSEGSGWLSSIRSAKESRTQKWLGNQSDTWGCCNLKLSRRNAGKKTSLHSTDFSTRLVTSLIKSKAVI